MYGRNLSIASRVGAGLCRDKAAGSTVVGFGPAIHALPRYLARVIAACPGVTDPWQGKGASVASEGGLPSAIVLAVGHGHLMRKLLSRSR
jgi:hypothetical protein